MSSDAAEAVAAMIASRAIERQAEYARKQKAAANLAAEVTDMRVRRAYALPLRHAVKLAHAQPRGRAA